MKSIRKQGASGVFGIIALILAVAAMIATVVCSSMNPAYALSAPGSIIGLEVLAIVLAAAGLILDGTGASGDLVGIFPTLAAIVVLMLTIGQLINERILLMSGLFSYNSQNTAGWRVFYVTVVAVAGLLLSALTLIIRSFLRSRKDA